MGALQTHPNFNEFFPNAVITLLLTPAGGPSAQVRLYHLLPGRPAQKQSQEDL